MRQKIKQALRRQAHQPPRWAILVNPFYLIRRALFVKVRAIAPQLHGTILDFGCGSKPFENLFVNAASYTGLDIAVSGHSHADSKVDIFYDGRNIPFEDATLDNVVSFEVFEHVFNLEEMLVEIHHVLRPGGTLLASLPFCWDEHERPYDFARYTTFGIQHLLVRAGFEVDRIERTNGFNQAVAIVGLLYLYYISRTRAKLLNHAVQLGLLFPATLLSAAICAVTPKIDTLFSGMVVVARRPATAAGPEREASS
jgi:SAM-dependent methyltransferase